ncbi:MAG TPA: hypothetical protein VNT26_24550 [Candidatus Sulfotelmatobacter sp.]|nr:hypothetical protein [Candidatus Sulfotelmatobacter sp.]
MPGARLSVFPEPLARRGCVLRYPTDAEDLAAADSLQTPIIDKLSHWIALRYAAAAQTLAPADQGPESELRSLRDLCQAIVALRRGHLTAEEAHPRAKTPGPAPKPD